MTPQEANIDELRRVRQNVAAGVPVDWKREAELAAIDDVIAEAFYTQQAIERVHAADDDLEKAILGDGNRQ